MKSAAATEYLLQQIITFILKSIENHINIWAVTILDMLFPTFEPDRNIYLP